MQLANNNSGIMICYFSMPILPSLLPLVQSLMETPIDSEGDFMESDASIDDLDEDDRLEERMGGVDNSLIALQFYYILII